MLITVVTYTHGHSNYMIIHNYYNELYQVGYTLWIEQPDGFWCVSTWQAEDDLPWRPPRSAFPH